MMESGKKMIDHAQLVDPQNITIFYGIPQMVPLQMSTIYAKNVKRTGGLMGLTHKMAELIPELSPT